MRYLPSHIGMCQLSGLGLKASFNPSMTGEAITCLGRGHRLSPELAEPGR